MVMTKATIQDDDDDDEDDDDDDDGDILQHKRRGLGSDGHIIHRTEKTYTYCSSTQVENNNQ